MFDAIKVLVLEDNSGDAELMMAQLRSSRFIVNWQRVDTEADYLAQLDQPDVGLDIILGDFSLPQFDALRALRLLHERGLDIPFIIISGKVSDEFIVEAMKQGAADFLLKDRMARLGTAVEQALERQRLRSAKKAADAALLAERLAVQLANSALAIKNKQLSELYQAAQHFVDDVSHEFRTPLSVIKGYSEILQACMAGPLLPEQKQYCQTIIDRTRDMAQMVDDLLDTSKLRAGSLRVDRRNHQVSTIFAAVHPILEGRIAASKVQWIEDVEPGLADVFADAEKVGRVILNLAVNAIKYSPEGSRIVLSAKAEGKEAVRITVADEGPGISAEDLRVIFQRFRQVGPVSSHVKGFGLGLNIAQDLVSLNLGQMNVESRLQEGSAFSFTLPVNDPEVIFRRLLEFLERRSTPAGQFAIFHVKPVEEGAISSELRGFIACTAQPGDVILPALDGRSLILFGYSESPTGWYRRLEKMGANMQQLRASQKLGAFKVEMLGTQAYPMESDETLAKLLVNLEQEPAYA